MKFHIRLAMVVAFGSVAAAQERYPQQSPSSQAVTSGSCHSIVLNGELSAGERFEKTINKDLVLRLEPQRLGPDGNISSWEISLVRVDDTNRDYIYPANPPLRFNGLQILGPSYGEDTKTSLSHPHRMRFLLSAEDYDRLWPLVTNALWPYNAPEPDKAADQYVSALQSLPTGELKLTILSYAADQATGSIQHINLRAEFTAPQSFALNETLAPKAAECTVRAGDVMVGAPEQQSLDRAQARAVVKMQSLGEKDTIAAANLSAQELHEIIDAVEESAYDTPDSWIDELRARRIDLGESPGIVLQGTKLLCGGTGNCQLFVFRKMNAKWVSLFGNAPAPLAESFQIGPEATHGIKDLTVVTNSGAESSQRKSYKFDGQYYVSVSSGSTHPSSRNSEEAGAKPEVLKEKQVQMIGARRSTESPQSDFYRLFRPKCLPSSVRQWTSDFTSS